jgi:phage tail-like protein
MARAQNTDFLQSFSFSLRDVTGTGDFGLEGDPFDFNGGESNGVGFTSVSGLVVQAETFQISEGTFPFARTFVRRASVSSVTLRRGMAGRDSDFYNWFHSSLYGYPDTRKNLLLTMNRRDGEPAKAWLLHDCIPVRVTCAPDLDATNQEIAIAELEIQPTYFEELAISES